MQATDFNSIRILSIDGSEIYRAMHKADGKTGITVRDKNGKLNTDRFGSFLDISLDTDRMQKVYANHKELPGKFRARKEYTTAVVSVSFNFSVKELSKAVQERTRRKDSRILRVYYRKRER